ncbi:1834_t:CDS:2, partial [Entrophospora sp. SA101]
HYGPCFIRNCKIIPKKYHGITANALKKAKEKGTFNQYNYLEVGKQLCYPHYLKIIEPDRNGINYNSLIEIKNNEDIQILYIKQRKEDEILELNPINFQTMLEEAGPLSKGFFEEPCHAFIPERQSAYNKKEDRKKVVDICYSIAAIHNKFVNDYPLEIGLYLSASGVS